MPGLPPRVFLLSPARAGGERMGLLLNPRAAFALASEFQQKGAAVGALFEFASGLYFRGKLAYARAFGRGPRGGSGALAIVPGRGLMDVEQRITAEELRACRDGAALRATAGSDPPRPPPPKAPAVLMRVPLPARLGVGDGCREQGARRGEVAAAQGGAGCFDIALRLARESGLRLVELGFDAAVAAGEPLLRGVERVHGGLHRCAPALALLFRRLPLRFR